MKPDQDIRWGVERRLEFLEWRAFWNGRVNRKDLQGQFQISTPQASADFSRYQEAAPRNISYDPVEKTFLTGPDFRPKFLHLSPERYLLQLEALETSAITKRDTWFEELPPMAVTPSISRGPEAFVLRAVLKAIRDQAGLSINYRSLKKVGMRRICPHALGYDGYRWHVRALAPDHGEFRDYVLGRILSFQQLSKSEAHAEDDVEWNTLHKLHLIAHPALDAEQRKTVEHDYRMQNGRLELEMRLALAYYFIRRHNLDLRKGEIPPERAQLSLKNFEEISTASENAKAASRERVAKRVPSR